MYKYIQSIQDPECPIYYRFMGMRDNGQLYSPQVGFDFPMETWVGAYHIPKIDMSSLTKIWGNRRQNQKAYYAHRRELEIATNYFVNDTHVIYQPNFSTGHVVVYDFRGFAVTTAEGYGHMNKIFYKTAPTHDGSGKDNKLCIVACRADSNPREAEDSSIYKLCPCYIFDELYIEEIVYVFE